MLVYIFSHISPIKMKFCTCTNLSWYVQNFIGMASVFFRLNWWQFPPSWKFQNIAYHLRDIHLSHDERHAKSKANSLSDPTFLLLFFFVNFTWIIMPYLITWHKTWFISLSHLTDRLVLSKWSWMGRRCVLDETLPVSLKGLYSWQFNDSCKISIWDFDGLSKTAVTPARLTMDQLYLSCINPSIQC